MSAQQKRERPEYSGESQKNRPEMQDRQKPQPEMTGRGEPGTMPENPANVDRQRAPAGLPPGTGSTKENSEKRGKS